MNHFQHILGCSVLVALLSATSVWADGGNHVKKNTPEPTASLASPSPEPTVAPSTPSPNYQVGLKAIDQKNWATAIDAFGKAVKDDPKNADAWNYLAFSYRSSGNLKEAFKNYSQALSINPDHTGAHEYLGEAYLQSKLPDKAEGELKKLLSLCGSTCDHYLKLKVAVENYKAGKPISLSTW